ncbi:alpha/beta hydrolase [Microvirga brassicacearum]|uniref:Alpha/beta hydrolase n=1 Tax=Microvirga brassicacearum TaxID=2580413 RepID=A0A5N3P7J5_9HYPH|nr:alpha/beta hydrolase [Microvirga brassicacearum]KAB0265709.1 alpha/beta hydrolase [Microvirga brassicacearum]
MWIAYLTLGAGLLYIGLVTATSIAQTKLLFPTQIAAANRPNLPPSAERLEVRTPDGEHLIGVRLQAQSGLRDTEPLLLGFAGNAWNAETMALYLHGLFPESEIVTFHYRGYPPSSGQPGAEALLSDSLSIFDHLMQERERRVVAVGFSVGSGVAAYLACHRPLAGMILVTPFDSLKALAREHFPWAPVGLLLRHHMPIIDLVRDTTTPTALLAAGRDTIVPSRRSEPLRQAIPNLVLDRTIAETGHNDLYNHPAFARAMREALAKIEAATPPQTSSH